MDVILASSSPRRRELLEHAGLRFSVVHAVAEELHDAAMPPSALCEENASRKAREVAASHPAAVVIGADTLVFLDGAPLGKPADLEDARAMLRRLSGRSHTVCTGVCVIRPGGCERCFHEITVVTFRHLTEEEIGRYVALANPLDKAGAYGIQEHGDLIIEGIRGAYDNVMGLPVAAVLAELARESGCP